MHKHIVRTLSALTLAAGLSSAASAATIVSAPVLQVTLTGWAYGSGGNVQSTGYGGAAGGFGGTLTGAGSFSTTSFLTYCIELEEEFSFSPDPMLGYAVVDGATYFQNRRGDAGIADRLGRLMTYVASNPTAVDTADESTSLQLAIWNMVYDTDYSVTTPGSFRDLSSYAAGADALLAGAQSVTTSRYDVFALEHSGTQDFLLLSLRPGSDAVLTPAATVPEPGSLMLAAAALAGLTLACRQRRA